MKKIFFVIILVIVLAQIFSYIKTIGGGVNITFGQYEVLLTLNFAIVLLLCTAILLAVLIILLRGILLLPKKLAKIRKARRLKKGYDAISDAFFALEAQDTKKAQSATKKATQMLENEPLTLMLQYQSEQNQTYKTKNNLQKLLENSKTRSYAIRKLYEIAQKDNDQNTMQNLAAQEIKNDYQSEWANQAIVQIMIGQKEFQKAIDLIKKQKKIFQPIQQNRKIAVLYLACIEEMQEYHAHKALNFAKNAYELKPDFVPAVCEYARALIGCGKERKARNILEKNWQDNKHPQIAKLYAWTNIDDGPYERIQRLQKLQNKYGESEHLTYVIALETLACKRFGQAREMLRPLLKNNSQRIFRLMAEIEEKDARGSIQKSKLYYQNALNAEPDYAWVAGDFVSEQWYAIEPINNGFDKFEWKKIPYQKKIFKNEKNQIEQN